MSSYMLQLESETAPKEDSRGRDKYIPVNRYIATVSSYTSPQNLPLFPLLALWAPSPSPLSLPLPSPTIIPCQQILLCIPAFPCR
jgi:hypothetical protein